MSIRALATVVLFAATAHAACGASSMASPTATPPAPITTPEPATEVTNPFTPVVEVLTPPPDIDTSGWLTYRDDANGFELKYPPNATLREHADYPTGLEQSGTVFQLQTEPETNLEEESFFIPDARSAENVCRSEPELAAHLSRVRVVNSNGDVSFWSSPHNGTGGTEEWYRTIYFSDERGSCVSLATTLRLGNIDKFPRGTRVADRSSAKANLFAMLATFRWRD